MGGFKSTQPILLTPREYPNTDLRFVILTHDWPFPHWDFLAERDGVLRAWRLLTEPKAGEDVAAEPNFDHRLHYLDYEGPLSGDRGRVTRWDRGPCEWLRADPECAELVLRGAKLVGTVVIRDGAFRFTAPRE